MNLKCFNLTIREGWALLEMARPERLNVIDEQALIELREISNSLQEQNIKVVVLTGQGKAFAAGADVAAMAKMDTTQAEMFSRLGNQIFHKIEEHPAIFIAAINGYALGGGCELALACDLRFASNKASFAQPEINLGIIPGFGGTQRLPRLVGAAKAKEWIFTGQRFSAKEALQAGLVSKIFEPDQLLFETQKFAEELATKSGPILALAKQAIGASGTAINSEHGTNEANFFGKCFGTHDGLEGMRAFLDKRKPNFEDR